MKLLIVLSEKSFWDCDSLLIDSIWTDKDKAIHRAIILDKDDEENKWNCYEIETNKENVNFEEVIE